MGVKGTSLQESEAPGLSEGLEGLHLVKGGHIL